MNTDLENIVKWSRCKRLQINAHKTQYVIIGLKKKIKSTIDPKNITAFIISGQKIGISIHLQIKVLNSKTILLSQIMSIVSAKTCEFFFTHTYTNCLYSHLYSQVYITAMFSIVISQVTYLQSCSSCKTFFTLHIQLKIVEHMSSYYEKFESLTLDDRRNLHSLIWLKKFNYFSQSFTASNARFWNDLPSNFNDCPNDNNFKIMLKIHLSHEKFRK
ncbi:hypothetical protein PR048_004871 [Dryococelus australis]|uniref:Uncharacterized protein n=1 Tax=Dryococelus australis TaxID=614101 RepID=A0ABQ9I6L5_9NEOP|nr:hypothetical protein PR048_004871 [Dryococelus australis]